MKTLAVHCQSCVGSAAVWHSAGCRTFWVCLQHHATVSHLMVLQYVAASFHLPSVSTANSNTVQYTKPYQQCEIPTKPAVVISKVLLPQSIIMAAVVHSHRNLFLNSLHICKNTEVPMSHNLQFYSLRSFPDALSDPHPNCPTANIQQYILFS